MLPSNKSFTLFNSELLTGLFFNFLNSPRILSINLNNTAGDVAESIVMIPVDLIVAEIGRNLRLEPEKIIVARYRGNSAQQMGVYGREEARESVIIFRKP